MNTRHFALYLCCLLFCVVGCKKPEDVRPCDTEPYYRPVHDDLHPFIFGDSSQWIYVRTLDGVKDTVNLVSSARSIYEWQSSGGTGNMTGGCGTVYFEDEIYGLNYQSSLKGAYWESFHEDEVHRSGNPPGLTFWAGSVGQTRNYVAIQAVHDSLVIGANTFRNVLQVQTGVGVEVEPGTWRFYLCPNVGIVRKEVMWGPDSVYVAYDLVEWQVQPHP